MADALHVGVNLDAFSHAISGIQALRSSVSRVFESLKDGMKNRETLEGREKIFISGELERLSGLVGRPSESHPLHNSGLLSLDPVQDKTPLYSQLLQAYKWSNKLLQAYKWSNKLLQAYKWSNKLLQAYKWSNKLLQAYKWSNKGNMLTLYSQLLQAYKWSNKLLQAYKWSNKLLQAYKWSNKLLQAYKWSNKLLQAYKWSNKLLQAYKWFHK
ncbi:hypothetical protein KUCAC02_033958, partial [Chaenocephalus aceratus]